MLWKKPFGEILSTLMQGRGPSSTVRSSFKVCIEALNKEGKSPKLDDLVEEYIKLYSITGIPLEEAKLLTSVCDKAIVNNRLLWAIAKCGSTSETKEWIQQLPTPDRYSKSNALRTALLVSYAHSSVKSGSPTDIQFLSNWVTNPSVCQNTALIHAYRKKFPLLFKSVYQEILSNKLFKPDIVFFTVILQDLFDRGEVEKAKEIIGSILESPEITIDVRALNVIIHGLCKQDSISEALQVYEQFSSLSLKPDDRTFQILIQDATKRGMIQTAFRIYSDIEKRGIEPSLLLLGSCVTMFCNSGDVQEAQRIFDGIVSDRKYRPSEEIYIELMKAYYAVNDHVQVKKLYQQMIDSGGKFTMLTRKYYISSMKPGSEEQMLFYKQEVDALKRKTGVELLNSMYFFTAFLDSNLNGNLHNLANTVMEDARSLILNTNPLIRYQILYLCRSGIVNSCELADNYLIELKIRNIPLDSSTYHDLLGLYQRHKKSARVIALANKFLETNTATFQTIYALLKTSFKRRKRFDELVKLYEGIPWDGYIYSLVINRHSSNYIMYRKYFQEYLDSLDNTAPEMAPLLATLSAAKKHKHEDIVHVVEGMVRSLAKIKSNKIPVEEKTLIIN